MMRVQLPVRRKNKSKANPHLDLSPEAEQVLRALEQGERSQVMPMPPRSKRKPGQHTHLDED